VRHALAAAGAAATALAYEEEIGHLLDALRVLDEAGSDDDETRCDLLLDLADRQLFIAGDVKGSAERAAEIARRHGWSDRLARAAVEHARIAEYGVVDRMSVALLEQALDALDETDSPLRARALARLAVTLMNDPAARERARELSGAAVAMARRLDDPLLRLDTMTTHATVNAGPDTLEDDLRLLEEMRELSLEFGNRIHRFEGFVDRIRILIQLGRLSVAELEAAANELDGLVRKQHRQGTYFDADAHNLRALLATLTGDLVCADAHADRSRAILAKVGDPDVDYVHTALLAPIRLAQGRAAELVETVEPWVRGSPHLTSWRAVLALAHVRVGRIDDAQLELRALVDDEAVASDEDWLGTQILLAEVCGAIGDADTARRLTARLEPYAGRIGLLIYELCLAGSVFRALALLAERAGDHDSAAAWHERAQAQVRDLGAPALAVRSDLSPPLEVAAPPRARP
jgi:hypothetical protein